MIRRHKLNVIVLVFILLIGYTLGSFFPTVGLKPAISFASSDICNIDDLSQGFNGLSITGYVYSHGAQDPTGSTMRLLLEIHGTGLHGGSLAFGVNSSNVVGIELDL